MGVLWALSRHAADVKIFAPDAAQAEVVNHRTSSAVVGQERNVLEESARIARGKIQALDELSADDFDAIIMPGGFGVAKNLSTFASQGAGGSVNVQLSNALKDFKRQKKPIGAVCISPALVALTFQGTPLELTVGASGPESEQIEKLGHRHIETRAHEIHVDRPNLVVSTPAYMYDDAHLHEVFEGIRRMVDTVVGMIDEKSA